MMKFLNIYKKFPGFYKIFSMNKKKSIGTHNGIFHADEVLACSMLTKYTSLYQNAEITRTRSLPLLENFDIVIDVGGVYDPSKNRFDHHQKEFQDTLDAMHFIRLSSAGLIYKHFGREILRNLIEQRIMKDLDKKYDIKAFELTDKFIDIIYYKLYDSFIKAVDALDNGVSLYSKELFEGKTVEPNYSINSSFEARISRLNPTWTEKNPNENDRFLEAIELADEELVNQVRFLVTSWWPARPIVQEAIEKRFEISKSGVIIKLSRACPWKDHLGDIEKENDLEGKLRFVLFQEGGPNPNWRVQGINYKGSFDLRLGLNKSWRGVTDVSNLARLSGFDDIIFCHASGFIGGAKSLESVIKMAEYSLEN